MNTLRLTDYISADQVIVGASPLDKESTLRLLVELAARRGIVSHAEEALTAVQQRELVVSTGVGNGVAIPHADLPEIEAPRLCLGVFPEGVDFEALDEEPVYVVFLLLGTPRSPGLHMKILARIARLSKDPEFRNALRAAATPQEIVAALEHIEQPPREALP